MPRLSSVQRLLGELVARPSINPTFLEDRPDLTGEERVAEFLEEMAKTKGIEVRRQPVLPGRKNLIARISPSGKAKHRVMLTPHLDVVPAPEKDFTPRVRQGKMYGRGTCDTKGSVAAFFSAFLELAQKCTRPRETEILFVGLVDEEFGQAGSRMLAQKGPKGDLAIAGEPTGLQVVTAHKGNLWIQLKTSGKSAHGSTPQHGKNAIDAMAPILEFLFGDYPKDLGQRTHPLLGSPTVSVGKIRGGSQPNVVPNECVIDLDRRTIPGETETSVKQELVKAFKERRIPLPEFSKSRSVPCPPLDTDPDLPLVQSFLRAANRRKSKGVPYFTDASPIATGGTPALVFGPGNIAQAHSANEWVEMEQVDRAYSIVSKFLHSLP
ncbi:MAG: M20/M25/M40 family metallo-hydrolase [Opitutae bacterium]|nr:M20/M25/M40 family metallo-hydrolase [Opitutae bacterium]